MKLSEKIRKIADPSTPISIKRGILRLIHPLPVSRFLKQIDLERLQEIQQQYGVREETRHWPKYVQAERFLPMNIRRVQDMGLDRMPPKRILDIGSGAGYFLFVCKALGHSGYGLDLPEPELYEDMFELFGLKRGIHRVEKFQPLPETGQKYDYVTAFSICFNDHTKPNPWGIAEWEYFLNDAAKHLNPGGRIYLALNPQKDDRFYDQKLHDWFVSQGAEIDRRSRLLFPPKAR